MMQALQDVHAHALAEDKSGTVALYGPSTWLTALSLECAGAEASGHRQQQQQLQQQRQRQRQRHR